MGKRKWRRVKLQELASAEAQERILGALDQAKDSQEGDSAEKRGSETAQVER